MATISGTDLNPVDETGDTVITTNPGANGPSLDADAVVQSDSHTAAVRERVEIGYQDAAFPASDPQQRLVGRDFPLPVESRESIQLLTRIANDIEAIRFLLETDDEE